MREMVLNHASIQSPDRDTAIEWLRDLAVGLSHIISEGVVQAVLRASRYSSEIYLSPDWTLFDAQKDLRQTGARDEFLLLATMQTRVPLLNGADLDVANRFRGCDHATLTRADGEPLLYCAISNSVSVGFPSSSPWDHYQVTVIFDELLPSGEFNVAHETIDNLTRSEHASTVIIRHREQIRDGLLQVADAASLWERRQEAFPNLVFGRDVEAHLSAMNPGELGTVVNRLASLDEAAARWPMEGGPAPRWRTLVTDEPSSVKNNPSLREARRFRSGEGTRQLYMWHARFGSNRRIHIRFEGSSYMVEVGYIGPHLPLA